MRAIVLAAGRGQRMRPLTDTTPKPLLEVAGETLLGRHLRRLAAAGFREVVINHAWLGEQVEAAVGDGSAWGLEVRYSPEDPALETGGGIAGALPLLGKGPFAVVNGDVFTDYPFEQLPAEPAGQGHLVLAPNPDHHAGGDFSLEAGRVRASGGTSHTYTGIAVLRPSLFADRRVEPFPLGPLLQEAAGRDELAGELYTGVWNDVGTPGRLDALRRQHGDAMEVTRGGE
ncbi:MAG: N-acetylmuramate alpha-1-phosphate uridylyltransferase MurU [Thiohalospira sp.]